MRLLIIALAILLSGCGSNPLANDDKLLTLATPNGDTDCQYRVTTARTDGKGLIVDGGFNTRIVTFIGPDNCPEGMAFDVPVTRSVVPNPVRGRGVPTDQLRGFEERLRRTQRELEQLRATIEN